MTRLICCGDWHIRSTRPKNRIDDYQRTQMDKISFILKRSGDFILQPGDYFDSPNISYKLLSEYINLFLRRSKFQFAVLGQHDLRYHTLKDNSPLSVLDAAKIVTIVGNKKQRLADNVHIYGASWGEEIPTITTTGFNILLLHKMVYEEKTKEIEFISDATQARTLIRNTKYDLIVSGDNHKFFIESIGSRYLINCGSLMRSNIDQKDHQPAVVLFDIDMTIPEVIEIPIRPFEEVMNLEMVEQEKERNKELEAFVEGLKENKEMNLDFLENLRTYLKENGIDKAITNLIEECI